SKLKDMLRLNVMELATTRVVSVEADDDIVRVADILARKRIKKVPVIEDDKLVGVVSRSTIVRYMMQQMMQSAAE
ncbi:MAG: CBS domain-containing protein, partial [Firmicutes bacterium]|nr:CBS domain-containing protein [Bacillota bacterium]